MKPWQRRSLPRLIGEGKIEELVEHIVGFESEPLDELPPAFVRAENGGVERERRKLSGVARHRVEAR